MYINNEEHEMGNNKFSIADINELFCVANESEEKKKLKQTASTKKKTKKNGENIENRLSGEVHDVHDNRPVSDFV